MRLCVLYVTAPYSNIMDVILITCEKISEDHAFAWGLHAQNVPQVVRLLSFLRV